MKQHTIDNVMWGQGFRSKVKVKVAYKEIERIRKRDDGNVTPEAVVSEAPKKTNPLHPAFTWDNTEAAIAYRLEEARLLMRSFHVVYDESPKAPMRIYQIDRIEATETEKPRNVYRKLEDILKDPVARALLLQRAMNDLIRIRRQYTQLQELAIVHRAIDEVLVTSN